MDFSVSNRSHSNINTNAAAGSTLMTLLNDNGEIYAYVSGHWFRTNEEPANPVSVSVGPGGFWCLDSVGNIHQWNEKPAESEWTRDTTIKVVTALSYDTEGNLWCVTMQGCLYFSNMQLSVDGYLLPQHVPMWTKAAFESAWFLNDTWEYTTSEGDHLLTVIRNQYNVTDDDLVYQIADEIVRLNDLEKRLDSVADAGPDTDHATARLS